MKRMVVVLVAVLALLAAEWPDDAPAVEYGVTPTITFKCVTRTDGSTLSTPLTGDLSGVYATCWKDTTKIALITNGNQDAGDLTRDDTTAAPDTYRLLDATTPNTLSDCFDSSTVVTRIEVYHADALCEGYMISPHFNFDASNDTVARTTLTDTSTDVTTKTGYSLAADQSAVTVGTCTDVTNGVTVSGTVDADIESVNEVAVTDIDDFKASAGSLGSIACASTTITTTTGVTEVNIDTVADSTLTLTWDLGADYTGYTPTVALKEWGSEDATTYAVDPVTGTWTDETAGTGTVTIPHASTAGLTDTYSAELLLTNGAVEIVPRQWKVTFKRRVHN